jgi:hypothetical protein
MIETVAVLTDDNVRDQLRRLVEHHGSLREAAAKLKLSHQYLNAVLHGHRAIGPRLLKVLRLREIITYEEIPVARSDWNVETVTLEQIRWDQARLAAAKARR